MFWSLTFFVLMTCSQQIGMRRASSSTVMNNMHVKRVNMKCSFDGSIVDFSYIFSIIRNLLLLAFFQFFYTIFSSAAERILLVPLLVRCSYSSRLSLLLYIVTHYSRDFVTIFLQLFSSQFHSFFVHYLNLMCISE